MRGMTVLVFMGIILAAGCKNTPTREMRQQHPEEFAIPPTDTYNKPPDLPRDQPLLTPKSQTGMGPNGAGPNTPGVAGMPSPVSSMNSPGRR